MSNLEKLNKIFCAVFSVDETALNADFDKNKHFDFSMSGENEPQRLKINFIGLEKNQPLTISQIKLNDKPLKLNKFNISGAEHQLNKNKLILTPQMESVVIYYTAKLPFQKLFRFNYYALLLILFRKRDFTFKIRVIKLKTAVGNSKFNGRKIL